MEGIDGTVSNGKEYEWPDHLASFASQARSGTLKTASLLYEWNKGEKIYAKTDKCVKCGERQTVKHIPECQKGEFREIEKEFGRELGKKVKEANVRIRIRPDDEVKPTRNNTIVNIDVGYFGVVHRTARKELVRLGMEDEKVVGTLRKMVVKTLEKSHKIWLEACRDNHLEDGQM